MPCLDMRNGWVVKGVHFVDIRDAGGGCDNITVLIVDYPSSLP